MAQGQCLFLLTTVLCSVSCLQIGTSVTLESKFNIEPSRVVPPEYTTFASGGDVAKTPILAPQIAATDAKTENPSLAKLKSAPDVATKPYTIIPITRTITTTPQLVPIKIAPEIPEETMTVIEPTSVVKLSTLQTIDVPELDLAPPKKR